LISYSRMADDAADSSQAFDCARLIYEQHEYLLDDERAYAESLKGARKTATTLVVLVLGVGVLRVNLGEPPTPDDVLPAWAIATVQWSFTVSALAVLLGAYLLYTDRPVFREFVPPRSQTHSPERVSAAALASLFMDDEEMDSLRTRPPVEV